MEKEGYSMKRKYQSKPEWYKTAYNKLYSFLRTKHPEVLQEYRYYLKGIKQRLTESIIILDEKVTE